MNRDPNAKNERMAGGPAAMLVATILLGASPLAAQDSKSNLAATKVGEVERHANARPDAAYLGPVGCLRCHRVYDPTAGLKNDFVLSGESKIFDDHDQHRHAFDVLWNDLGRRILKNLSKESSWPDRPMKAPKDGAAPEPSEDWNAYAGALSKDQLPLLRQCMSCHANWRSDIDQFTKAPPEHFERGVSCESCHGPSKGWFQPHFLPIFRKDPIALASGPNSKESKGLIDVRDPEKRAEQCASCHIGNIEQGKFVTHEMYAAGHPQLPGMEIATFSRAMPSHWRSFKEKADFENRKEYIQQVIDTDQADPEQDSAATKAVLIGALVSLRENLRLIVDSRSNDGRVYTPDKKLPPRLDFAHFDCQACHHGLSASGKGAIPWRQQRRIPGVRLGQPSTPLWPETIIHAGVVVLGKKGGDAQEHEASYKQLQESLVVLRRNVSLAPLGATRHGAMKDAAVQAADQLNAWIKELRKTPLSADDAAVAIDDLVAQVTQGGKTSPERLLDFHSARRVAWAIQELELDRARGYSTPLVPQTDAEKTDPLWLFKQRQKNAPLQKEFADRPWTARLSLTLPAFREGKSREERYDDWVDDALGRAAEYDPEWFRKQLEALKH